MVNLSFSRTDENHSRTESKFILSLESSVSLLSDMQLKLQQGNCFFLSQLCSCPTFLCNSTNPTEKKVQGGRGAVQSCTIDQVPNFFFFFFYCLACLVGFPRAVEPCPFYNNVKEGNQSFYLLSVNCARESAAHTIGNITLYSF